MGNTTNPRDILRNTVLPSSRHNNPSTCPAIVPTLEDASAAPKCRLMSDVDAAQAANAANPAPRECAERHNATAAQTASVTRGLAKTDVALLAVTSLERD